MSGWLSFVFDTSTYVAKRVNSIFICVFAIAANWAYVIKSKVLYTHLTESFIVSLNYLNYIN